MNQQQLWNKLARENANYYIYTPGGRSISPKDYRNSGLYDYKRLIGNDDLIPKGGAILDFACGNGRITEFMRKDFALVIGVDISEEMIIGAKGRLGENDFVWKVTDGYTINLASNSIDVVFAGWVFPHMKEREMVESNFSEIKRVLVKDGVCKVYMKNDLGKEKDNDLKRWWNGVTYSVKDATKLLNSMGFEILNIEYVPRKTNYWMTIKCTTLQ